MSAKRKRTVDLQIEKLVLRGFRNASPEQIRQKLALELTRQVAASGEPKTLAVPGAATRRISTDLPANLSADASAPTKLARAIRNGLASTGGTHPKPGGRS